MIYLHSDAESEQPTRRVKCAQAWVCSCPFLLCCGLPTAVSRLPGLFPSYQSSADVFSAELMKSSPTAFLFSAPLYWCSWHVYWLKYIDGSSLHFSSGCSVALGKVYSADLSQSDNKQSLQNLFGNLLDICMNLLYWPFSVSSNSWLIPK